MKSSRGDAAAASPSGPSAGVRREPERLSRKQREFQRHQRDAQRAAERLLFEHSYQDITVNQVAQEAEFSVGYLYKLFSNKETLFASVIRERHREMFELIEEGLQSSAPVPERLRALLIRLFEWIDEHMAYAASSWRDLFYLFKQNAELHEEVRRRDQEMQVSFRELFAEGTRSGHLADVDPQRISLVFRAVLWGIVRLRITGETQGENAAELAELVAQVVTRTFAPAGREN
jgi:AcrR family transcriptional regulator